MTDAPTASPARGGLSAEETARALAVWRDHDAAHALHALDREAVRGADAARSLVLDLLARPEHGRDLYNACARLGRLLAEGGASPSLAVATAEGAARALADLGIVGDGSRLAPARASVAEGYFAVIVEGERVAARRGWEYPACAVRVATDTVAIVAGYPGDDGEALADWSARVALAISRDGYKRAILEGNEATKAELAQALSLVGVELAPPLRQSKGWLAALLGR